MHKPINSLAVAKILPSLGGGRRQ